MPTLKLEEQAKVDIMKGMLSREFRIGITEFEGPCRDRRVAWPRAIAMQILYQDGDIRQAKIGEAFGGRDHSTVKNAIERADYYASQDLEIFLRRETLRDRFQNLIQPRKEIA